MKKLLSVFSVIALVAMFACQSGIKPEELEAAKKTIAENEAKIADLNSQITKLQTDLQAANDTIAALKAKLATPAKPGKQAAKPEAKPAPAPTPAPTPAPATQPAGRGEMKGDKPAGEKPKGRGEMKK